MGSVVESGIWMEIQFQSSVWYPGTIITVKEVPELKSSKGSTEKVMTGSVVEKNVCFWYGFSVRTSYTGC